MEEPLATASLWDYRRRVAELYAEVRRIADPEQAWHRWRAGRDDLFAHHPQSALAPELRREFAGLAYFPYDPAWRIVGTVTPAPAATLRLGPSGDGATPARRFGEVRFVVGEAEHVLGVYWLESYGGGVFLPFRDATSDAQTYGGGRYLLDTAKGADLGGTRDEVVLDFNFAYHPSCVHDRRWSCPLAPADNRLDVAVEAGERLPA